MGCFTDDAESHGHRCAACVGPRTHLPACSTMPTVGVRSRRTTAESPTFSEPFDEPFDPEKQSSSQRVQEKRGLSLTQIRGGRLWLRFRSSGQRQLAALGISVLFMFFCKRSSKGMPLLDANLQSTCAFRQRPLMVQLQGRNSITQLALEEIPEHFVQDRRNHYWINGGAEWHDRRSERKEGCVALGKWQDEHHPSCLVVHEIDLAHNSPHGQQEQFRFLGSGHYRDAIMFREYDGNMRALKTYSYTSTRGFDERIWDKHRRDAMATEQMTNSPHIINIYGYCTNAAVVDYSDKGSLERVFQSKPSKAELLKVAHDVACAVRDAHHFDDEGRATIAHCDIKLDQFLLVNDVYQLNDFNRAKFLSWDPERNEQCGFTFELDQGNWRAPEEYSYKPETEKIDVWSLGNVLYYLLTRREPFDKYNDDEIPAHVMEGNVPDIKDATILNSTHLFDITLLKVVKMCWEYDPKKRPSSRQVASILQEALNKLN